MLPCPRQGQSTKLCLGSKKSKTLPCPPQGQYRAFMENKSKEKAYQCLPQESNTAQGESKELGLIMVPRKPRKNSSVCIGQVSNTGLQFGNTALPSARAGQHFVVARPAPFWRTKEQFGSTSSTHRHQTGAPEFSALPSARAGQHPAAHTNAPCSPQGRTHQILPCPPQRQGRLLGAIWAKIQFNSIPHQIE